jgi:hypothetical protein
MNKFLLIVGVAILAVSCGKSNGEQMLYNYQQDNVKNGLNMELEDLEFEIKEVKEVGKITAADSARIYEEKLPLMWFGDDVTKEESDTLSFDYVLTKLDAMKKSYQEIIIANIKLGEEYKNYEWTKKRDNATDAYFEVLEWELAKNSFQKKPDSILSIKYQATYSINNPMLNNSRQTFDKYYYSDPENSNFIKEEMVVEGK